MKSPVLCLRLKTAFVLFFVCLFLQSNVLPLSYTFPIVCLFLNVQKGRRWFLWVPGCKKLLQGCSRERGKLIYGVSAPGAVYAYKLFHSLYLSWQQPYKVGRHLQKRKLNTREIKCLAQGHTVKRWSSQLCVCKLLIDIYIIKA